MYMYQKWQKNIYETKQWIIFETNTSKVCMCLCWNYYIFFFSKKDLIGVKAPLPCSYTKKKEQVLPNSSMVWSNLINSVAYQGNIYFINICLSDFCSPPGQRQLRDILEVKFWKLKQTWKVARICQSSTSLSRLWESLSEAIKTQISNNVFFFNYS